MYILFSNRLLSASSISQGKFVAARTITTLLGSSLRMKYFLEFIFFIIINNALKTFYVPIRADTVHLDKKFRFDSP